MDEKKETAQASTAEAIMRELRFAGLDKENLKDLVEIATAIRNSGLKKTRVFPKGIPVPDGIRVSGIMESGEAKNLLADLLLKTPRVDRVVAFPYGIPFPDTVRVDIDVGGHVGPGPVQR